MSGTAVRHGERERRIALVSGANRGLGKEVARQLAQRGVSVVLGCRDPIRGEETAGELRAGGCRVTQVQLDVTDRASVANAVSTIGHDYGRLDILVNNAGVRVDAPTLTMSADEMRETFEVNVFGAVNTIGGFLPLLMLSPAPRIVNVSSRMGSLALGSSGTPFGSDIDLLLAYSSSKAALNMLTVRYAQAFDARPATRHLKINSVTPGFLATDMTHHQGRRSPEAGAKVVVALAELPPEGSTGGFFNDDGVVPW